MIFDKALCLYSRFSTKVGKDCIKLFPNKAEKIAVFKQYNPNGNGQYRLRPCVYTGQSIKYLEA